MVACHRYDHKQNCTWAYDPDTNAVIDYDIWLVNGNPYTSHQNPFEYQFSFEMQVGIQMTSN